MIEVPVTVQRGRPVPVEVRSTDSEIISEGTQLSSIGECAVFLCRGPKSGEAYCNDEWHLIWEQSFGKGCPFSKS